jgi:Zn-dependent peptidase ImmA (M78 family)
MFNFMNDDRFNIAFEKSNLILEKIDTENNKMIDTQQVIDAVSEVTKTEIYVLKADFSGIKNAGRYGAMMSVVERGKKRKATIILNSNENIDDKFRRFSLIHELGHLITGKYNVQSNVDKKKTKFILSSHIDYALSHISEKEYADEFLLNEEIANIFALRVLLPLKPLLVEITKLKDLKKVAAHFGVPEEAVNSRLNLEG